MEESFISFLNKYSIPYKQNVPIKQMSYIRIGGDVKLLINPQNLKQFVTLIKFTKKHGMNIKVMGNFSNTLFDDSGYNSVIISNKGLTRFDIDLKKGVADVETGVMLPVFARRLSTSEITGYEGLIGIPGTVGGSLFMNAGAYGNEISDHLLDITYIDQSGVIKKIRKDDLSFSFRYSSFQKMKNCYILSARFALIKGEKGEIEKKIKTFQHHRATYQERKLPNLGSVYKTTDIYSDISKHYPVYRILLKIIREICRRFDIKDNKILNFITVRYFSIRYKGLKPFSDKTINCIVNRGDLSFAKAIDFINSMNKILQGSVELEIEVASHNAQE